MAQVTGRAQQQHILDIKQGCARSTHEIAKTGKQIYKSLQKTSTESLQKPAITY